MRFMFEQDPKQNVLEIQTFFGFDGLSILANRIPPFLDVTATVKFSPWDIILMPVILKILL